MKAKEMLARLERSCEERGVKLAYDDLRGEGGMCRLRDEYRIIINRRASTETRVRLISEALERIPARTPASPAAAEAPVPASETEVPVGIDVPRFEPHLS